MHTTYIGLNTVHTKLNIFRVRLAFGNKIAKVHTAPLNGRATYASALPTANATLVCIGGPGRLRREAKFPLRNFCGNSSVDRALAFQAGGRGFESRFPLQRDLPLLNQRSCCFSSVVERILGKDEVPSSTLGSSSSRSAIGSQRSIPLR